MNFSFYILRITITNHYHTLIDVYKRQPYDFTVANAMISNFHMPLSTLLMIGAAFGGYEQVMEAYNVALKEEYRFGTYGDAMLITDR